jgi:hypothetical protein
MASTIFSGAYVKALKSKFNLNDSAHILADATDPRSSATTAPIGSIHMNTATGAICKKLDAGSSTNWAEVGSGTGSINYIKNYDGTSVTGWATYKDAAAINPVDGTGGSATLTYTSSSSSLLRGTTNFLFNVTDSSQLGEGASYDFTIDPADQAKMLTIKFDYVFTSAASSYTDRGLTLWIYDVTNAVLIQPAGFNLQYVAIPQNWSATFQTASNSTSYRLILHNSLSLAAYAVRCDNWSIGPQSTSYGAAMSDWVSYTPTGSWTTNTTYTGKWRRVGDNAEFRIAVNTSGAPTAVGLDVNLPSGMVVDFTKTPSGVLKDSDVFGVGSTVVAGVRYRVSVALNSATAFRPRAGVDSSTSTFQQDNSPISQATPATYGAGNDIMFNAIVPITGWSSNTIQSSDTDTRVVAAQANGATATITGTDSDVTFLNYTSNTGSFNGITYTVPVAGWYEIHAKIRTTAVTIAVDNSVGLHIIKGSTIVASTLVSAGATTQTKYAPSVSYLNEFIAGDTIKIQVGCNMTTPSISASTAYNTLSIKRLSGPATITATETVACNYETTAGQSMSTSFTTIIFGNKIHDSHNAMNAATGVFTAPISGLYSVTGTFSDNTLRATSDAFSSLFFNGVEVKRSSHYVIGTSSLANPQMSYSGRLLAGQTIYLQGRFGYAANLTVNAKDNNIQITRTGN